MTASDLTAIGFDGENGAFRAPARVELNPLGMHFFEARITTTGGAISVVVHKTAVKVIRESASLAADR